MSNPLRRIVKTADIVAGAIAVLLALPNLDTQTDWHIERVTLSVLVVAALITGWKISQNRYWMLKIFLYAGVMVLYMLLARLSFYLLSL